MDCRTARDGTGFHELQTAIDRRIGRAAASKYVLRPGVDDGAGRNAACLDELEAAGIDDRADRRPKILLSTAIDRRGDHGAAGEDELGAAIHHRVARDAAGFDILVTGIDCRAGRGARVVLNAAVNGRVDRGAAERD